MRLEKRDDPVGCSTLTGGCFLLPFTCVPLCPPPPPFICVLCPSDICEYRCLSPFIACFSHYSLLHFPLLFSSLRCFPRTCCFCETLFGVPKLTFMYSRGVFFPLPGGVSPSLDGENCYSHVAHAQSSLKLSLFYGWQSLCHRLC